MMYFIALMMIMMICDCRKPEPGLFHLAQKKYNINFNQSFMIGDTWKDVEAAKNAGIQCFIR